MRTIATTMIIAIVAMIGMTGIIAATAVTYSGDGSYTANFNGYGTGTLAIHTYTSHGADHLGVGWQNTNMVGSQSMGQISDSGSGYDYTATTIDRDVTVGTGGTGQYATGGITTTTIDNAGNKGISVATYKDNKAYSSHVNTEQAVAFGSGNVGSAPVIGVVADTTISGHSYGSDTYVSGLIRTNSSDAYAYTFVGMDNGEFTLDTLGGAGTGFGAGGAGILVDADADAGILVDADADAGILVDADADGAGTFTMGAGFDQHGMDVDICDDSGYTHHESYGYDVNIHLSDLINDDDYTATGYIYAIEL